MELTNRPKTYSPLYIKCLKAIKHNSPNDIIKINDDGNTILHEICSVGDVNAFRLATTHVKINIWHKNKNGLALTDVVKSNEMLKLLLFYNEVEMQMTDEKLENEKDLCLELQREIQRLKKINFGKLIGIVLFAIIIIFIGFYEISVKHCMR